MSNAIKILPHYTYADYIKWEGNWELIEGLPIAMSPSPLLKHQRLASRLNLEFGIPLKKCADCIIYEPIDYKINEHTVVRPDMLISCKKENSPQFITNPPELIIEILSPSSGYRDRHEKFRLYETAKVRYYILVEPDEEKIEVYKMAENHYKQIVHGKNIVVDFEIGPCRAQVNFGEIW
ncbi:MAG TPA: Uma2 family endonuclease [Chitinophagaceae bacterium]|nr:Uma2 family endonuclease [Chitinophagaceae bacterium]